jgi:hypothetical protein
MAKTQFRPQTRIAPPAASNVTPIESDVFDTPPRPLRSRHRV